MLACMIDDLITKAGGTEAVAKGCKVSADALRKWPRLGGVPSRHWPWFAKKLGWSMDRVMRSAVDPDEKAAA